MSDPLVPAQPSDEDAPDTGFATASDLATVASATRGGPRSAEFIPEFEPETSTDEDASNAHQWQQAEPGGYDSCSRCGVLRFAYYAHTERRPCKGARPGDEDAYQAGYKAWLAAMQSFDGDEGPSLTAAIRAALVYERTRLYTALKLAAAGRRRYARTPHSHAEHLEHEAVLLDLAADVVAGDLTPMQSWLPSWMWTDEIREAGHA